MNYLAFASMLLVFGLYAWRTDLAYRQIISSLTDENKELRDRWNIAKGLPPNGVDLIARHEKKEQAKDEERKTRLPRTDPLTRRRHEALLIESKELEH